MTKSIPCIIAILFLIIHITCAAKTEVKILSGGKTEFRNQVEQTLTRVLNSINKHHETKASLADIGAYCTPEAFINLKEMVKKTGMYATEKTYETYLLQKFGSAFEVRDIKVRVFLGNTNGIPFQNLVFVLNEKGKIINTHFSLEKHQYDLIIEQGKKLQDIAYREKILHFIELYRTAYNKKDLAFITKTLSDDALIIVGHVVKTRPTEVDYINQSYLSPDEIEFIKLSKTEYLKRLEKIFRKNDFVRILFDQINIQRHPQLEKIYGVQLKQRWHSSTYSDEGYLFLLFDFIAPDEPLIHVRAWQPDKFNDGSTINLYDFEIIE